MPLSCVSAPALTEQEALEAKFFAAGSTRRGRSSSADMSPSYADESASAAFDTPDGTHVLAKRWTHPDGPRPFRPRCSPRAVVAGVPGAKKHRCLLVNAGDALVVHNFNPSAERGGSARDGHGETLNPSHPPIRVLTFPGTTVTAVAHREIAGDALGAPDILIGLENGEVLCVSLRALIADRDGKALPPGTRRFNTDGGGGVGGSARVVRDVLGENSANASANVRDAAARCTSVAWFAPKRVSREDETLASSPRNVADRKPSDRGPFRVSELFLSTHADGNAYVYSAALGDDVDPRFAELRGARAAEALSITPGFGVLDFIGADSLKKNENVSEALARERTEQNAIPNPFARVRVGPAALTAAAVAPGGEAVALAGADGRVRVLDVRGVASGDAFLVDGFKSHFGGVDAVAWAEGPPDDDDAYDDDDAHDDTREAREWMNEKPLFRLGRFRADVCADAPATPRFLLAGGEADVVEVWDRSRRALVARARGHASWVAHVAETPAGRDRTGDRPDARSVAADGGDARAFARVDHRYDDLLLDADAPRRLRFASAGQDCRVCFWELDVDPAPAWWVPVPVPVEGTDPDSARALQRSRSANLAVPGAKTAKAKESATEEDANEQTPPAVPPRARLGRAPATAARDVGSSPAADGAPPTSLIAAPSAELAEPPRAASSSLMFPTLREEHPRLESESRAKTAGANDETAETFNRDAVTGDGRVVARAASSRSTPFIAPASAHVLHDEPCTGVAFVDEGILTSCGGGIVKLWRRTR